MRNSDLQYDQELLNEINNNVNLLEYVESQMELEYRNGDYWAHCPLHIDNTPSLSFSPEHNSYYCFSCEKGGKAISYLMRYEHMDIETAIDKAARLGRIDLSKRCKSQTIIYLKNIKKHMIPKARPQEHPIIPQSEYDKYQVGDITEWLEEGIDQEMIDLFGVRLDTKMNRIVYPVYDINGKLINLKARTRIKDFKKFKIPKYINYFPVEPMDYFQCLNVTLPYILEQKEVIIFESIKSVMKAYQWGYKNCVSAEKHGMTDEQLLLILSLNVDITLAYDTDVEYFAPRKDNAKIRAEINKIRRLRNLHLIDNKDFALGGAQAKNAPVDCGKEVWERLYKTKRKIV